MPLKDSTTSSLGTSEKPSRPERRTGHAQVRQAAGSGPPSGMSSTCYLQALLPPGPGSQPGPPPWGHVLTSKDTQRPPQPSPGSGDHQYLPLTLHHQLLRALEASCPSPILCRVSPPLPSLHTRDNFGQATEIVQWPCVSLHINVPTLDPMKVSHQCPFFTPGAHISSAFVFSNFHCSYITTATEIWGRLRD